ncbi:uncharacterized protein LOC108732603 [Agrilus planipennis]|uniref:Uncharacterized protein LOC108732603 n=1 Tax=Agrilus planipennis TaxID=224129 RepID=A0A1W4WEW0_AGRPL|nr:uncharacterized protein LOC108732603 [Agrilus planipennis]
MIVDSDSIFFDDHSYVKKRTHNVETQTNDSLSHTSSSTSSTSVTEHPNKSESQLESSQNDEKPIKPDPKVKPRSRKRNYKTHHQSTQYSSSLQTHPLLYKTTSTENTKDTTRQEVYKVKELGNLETGDPMVCSLYITSFNALEDQILMDVEIDPFAQAIKEVISGKVRIRKTPCGLIVALTREEDASNIMSLPLQKIFNGPIQVARFQTGEAKFRPAAIIRDIPWCISNIEIGEALRLQGIKAGTVVRTKNYVKVEVQNALDLHRLVEEGLNFFDHAIFPASAETAAHADPDIVQCYRCQGFWHTSTHCNQIPRCVRCGGNHDIDYCPRPRNNPICCHCGGPHHAAYKLCPVRLRLMHSSEVTFTLSKRASKSKFGTVNS